MQISNGRARIVIEAEGSPEAAVAAIAAAGGLVTGHHAKLLRAWVPLSALRPLSNAKGVGYVRRPFHPLPAGEFDEGMREIHALSWHRHGRTGAGIKVAVIDLGFTGWETAVSDGDLPADVVTQDYCDGNLASATPHGTAVADLVHAVAPGATLYLICVADEIGLAQAETYLEDHNITIASHSVSWPNSSRGDGSGGAGTPDAIVAQADAAGILWVNAAGDTEGSHWQGTFSDTDSDGFLNFDSNHNWNEAHIPPGVWGCIEVKWDDWPTTATDYDMIIDSAETGQRIATSTNLQDGSQPPTESACFESPPGWGVYKIWIQHVGGSGTPRIDLSVFGGSLFFQTAGSSVVEPASSPHALSVGTFCYYSMEVEPFSSRGPTIDGRTAPDITGPDGIRSPIYGGNSWTCNPVSGFFGTSAAAPHVAGAAALVEEQHPDYTPAQVRSYLEANAIDSGDPGPDNAYGAGRLLLPSLGPALVDTTYETYTSVGALDVYIEVGGDSIGDATEVVFGGAPTTFSVDRDFQLSVKVPLDAVTGKIVVTTPSGSADTNVLIFPYVSTVVPDFGPAGAHVTIYGRGLKGATDVSFNGVHPSSVEVVSGHELDVVVPSGATTGNVTVTALGGQSSTWGPFTVTAAPPPKISGLSPKVASWGTSISIAGTGLVSTSAIAFGDVPAPSFDVVSDTEIDVPVPSGAQTAPITLTTAGGTAVSTSFGVLPTITDLEPASATAGATIVLTGTAFFGVKSVKLGKKKAAFIVNSPTQIAVIVPRGALSGSFIVRTSSGLASESFSLLPSISSFTPVAGAVGRSVKVTGDGLAGTTAVTVNGIPAVFKAKTSKLTFQVPLGASTGPIQITTPTGTVTSATAFTVTG